MGTVARAKLPKKQGHIIKTEHVTLIFHFPKISLCVAYADVDIVNGGNSIKLLTIEYSQRDIERWLNVVLSR